MSALILDFSIPCKKITYILLEIIKSASDWFVIVSRGTYVVLRVLADYFRGLLRATIAVR